MFNLQVVGQLKLMRNGHSVLNKGSIEGNVSWVIFDDIIRNKGIVLER